MHSEAQLSISPPRFGVLAAILGKLAHRLYKLVGRDRYDRHAIEWIDQRPWVVLPTVFNPRALRTGAFFAQQIERAVGEHTRDVLDMGTGSGICAVVAAQHANRVVAVDINHAAVRCARINSVLHQVDHKVDVRQGDLFAAVAGQRFDLILFNPPFLQAPARSERDCAWRSIDAVPRFARELTSHLSPGGCALVLLSTFGDAPRFVQEFYRHGLTVELFAQREYFNERVVIFKVSPGRHA